MSGKYIYDILQWILAQNGGHLFQNGRDNVVKFKIHLNKKMFTDHCDKGV